MIKQTRQAPRPSNMSQLDYLWTYFGGYSVATEASAIPQDDLLLTESAIAKLVSTTSSGGIAHLLYRNHPTNADLVQLIGTTVDGEQVTVVDMPKEVHVINFGASIVTSTDISKGCPFEIGTNIILLELSNGKRFYFNLDAYIGSGVSGGETSTIKTQVIDNIITSDLKLNTSGSIVQLSTSSEGLSADLLINPSEEGVILSKTNDGLQAKIPLKNSEHFIRFNQLSILNYIKLPVKDPGTLYFITDKPYIFLGEKRYGVDINPGEVPIVSLVYDADHMLLSYKKADGSDIQQIHMGPATEDLPGMISVEDYREFKKLGEALGNITNIENYIKDETDKLAISIDYGEASNNQKPLNLRNRLGEILSTVMIDVDNFLAAAQNKVATQQDVDDAILTGVTNIKVGDSILILTLVDGTKVYTNLRALVTNYQFKGTKTINLVENSIHEITADLNLVENKILYIEDGGLNANIQVERKDGQIFFYGKTKTEDCIIGSFQTPSGQLITGAFIPAATDDDITMFMPDQVDWKDYNQFTNKPIIGDPYYLLVYEEFTGDPSNMQFKNIWISIKPMLNPLRISDIEGNLIKKDENNNIYAVLEWHNIQ